jgi:lipid-binding SYLF domain-containing protein
MLVMPLIAAVACSSTYRSMTNQEKKAYLVDLERETLAELVAERPEAQTDLDSSVGYAVISNTAAKVPMVGAGEGIGVVVNTETGERTYLEVSRLDVGGGLGVRKFRLIIIFFDREKLEDLADGELEIGAGVEAGAGDHDDVGTGAGGVAGSRNENRAIYQLSESGVSVTYTVRMIKYSVLELDG